jgi:hypothetical protein
MPECLSAPVRQDLPACMAAWVFDSLPTILVFSGFTPLRHLSSPAALRGARRARGRARRAAAAAGCRCGSRCPGAVLCLSLVHTVTPSCIHPFNHAFMNALQHSRPPARGPPGLGCVVGASATTHITLPSVRRPQLGLGGGPAAGRSAREAAALTSLSRLTALKALSLNTGAFRNRDRNRNLCARGAKALSLNTGAFQSAVAEDEWGLNGAWGSGAWPGSTCEHTLSSPFSSLPSTPLPIRARSPAGRRPAELAVDTDGPHESGADARGADRGVPNTRNTRPVTRSGAAGTPALPGRAAAAVRRMDCLFVLCVVCSPVFIFPPACASRSPTSALPCSATDG